MTQGEQGRLALPRSLITPPCIAHCMRACSAKGGWSLFSLTLSRLAVEVQHKELLQEGGDVQSARGWGGRATSLSATREI